MMDIVRQYTPNTWVGVSTTNKQMDVYSYSNEYDQIKNEVTLALGTSVAIRRMIRVQDLHSFGQFLIREQLLINSNDKQLYRVRRYIKVDKSYLDQIIRYNLDPRRCGLGQSLSFLKKLTSSIFSQLIVVVKVLTTEPDKEVITPASSCEYYVEYVIEV